MSRWFRHYAGMMRDEKLVRVAVKSRQSVERVVWVWGAMLESAAEINDGGRYEFDAGEAAYFLRCDDADLRSIEDALSDCGRIADGLVAKWGERQYSSDASAERQRRYRQRKANHEVRSGDSDRNGDGEVTSRDGEVTLQETETETEDVVANATTSPEAEKSAPVAFELPLVSGESFPIFETDVDEWQGAFPAVNVRQQLGAMRSWLIANPKRGKTKRGIRRFAVTWLDRRQNDAGVTTFPRSGAPPNRKRNFVDVARDRFARQDDGPENVFGSGGNVEFLPARVIRS